MRTIIALILCLLTIFLGYSEEIVIKIYPRGEIANTILNIEYNKEGIITKITKKSNNDVIFYLNTNYRDDESYSILKDGKYTLEQKIKYNNNILICNYNESNSFTGSKNSGNEILKIENDVLYVIRNNNVYSSFSLKEKWQKDSSGRLIYQKNGNYVKSYIDEPSFLIENTGESLKISFIGEPAIAPPDVYLFSKKPKIVSNKALLFNYVILPIELRFILFLD